MKGILRGCKNPILLKLLIERVYGDLCHIEIIMKDSKNMELTSKLEMDLNLIATKRKVGEFLNEIEEMINDMFGENTEE